MAIPLELNPKPGLRREVRCRNRARRTQCGQLRSEIEADCLTRRNRYQPPGEFWRLRGTRIQQDVGAIGRPHTSARFHKPIAWREAQGYQREFASLGWNNAKL